MAEEPNSRRELLKKMLILGPLAAAAAVGIEGVKTAEATYDVNNNYAISGKLGVGTDNPGAKLHVRDPNGDGVILEDTTYSEYVYVKAGSMSNRTACVVFHTTEREWLAGGNYYSGAGKFEIADITGGGARVVIDTDGKVGIGTATPSTKLDVNGTARANLVQGSGVNYDGSGATGIATQNIGANTWGGFGENDAPLYLTANAIDFKTNSKGGLVGGNFPLRMRISQNGNVGIGKDNPATPLDVVGDITVSGLMRGKAQTALYDQ